MSEDITEEKEDVLFTWSFLPSKDGEIRYDYGHTSVVEKWMIEDRTSTRV